MASLIYDVGGALVDLYEGGEDVVVYGNNQVPYISGTQLQKYAAIIYAEAAYMGLVQQINPSNPLREMQREAFGIAVTMYNYARNKSNAFKKVGRSYGLNDLLVDSSYTKGINSPKYGEYFGTAGDENKRRIATLAVIKLFSRQFAELQDVINSLQGAAYWDGNDLFRRYRDHYRAKMGFELGNPIHGRLYQHVTTIPGLQTIQSCPAQDPKVSAKRQFTFLSTMTAGGTIFFRIHPQALAQGVYW